MFSFENKEQKNALLLLGMTPKYLKMKRNKADYSGVSEKLTVKLTSGLTKFFAKFSPKRNIRQSEIIFFNYWIRQKIAKTAGPHGR